LNASVPYESKYRKSVVTIGGARSSMNEILPNMSYNDFSNNS